MQYDKRKNFLIAFAVSAVILLVGYFILISPSATEADQALKEIRNNVKNLPGSDGRGEKFDKVLAQYNEKLKGLEFRRDNLKRSIHPSFTELLDGIIENPEDHNFNRGVMDIADFDKLRADIEAHVRKNHPGFPFKLSTPEIAKYKDETETMRAVFLKLAAAARLLVLLGEAQADMVLSFDLLEEDVPVESAKFEEAMMTIERKPLDVEFEGNLKSIFETLKLISQESNFFRIEEVSIQPSEVGYSLECDLRLSLVRVEFQQPEAQPQPERTPEPAKTPPAVTTEKPATPEPTTTPERTPKKTSSSPKKSQNNPVGW
ncbi:MAG: hypothetical protein U5N86_00795 [Planctomycetota bacterium]|nr:hypothetical protein [Planctomycetota bacterium]